MKFLRISTFFALTLSAASGFMLFSTAQKVQQAESNLGRVRTQVAQEEQTIRVLRAEWDYLNRPDRLEALVKSKLELIPATPESVRADTSELPAPYTPIVPVRKPAYSSPVAKAIPASLETQPTESSPQALPKPAAPQSPDQTPEVPQKDFNQMLNELAPAGGDE
jgi:hypothetical protein